MGKKKSIYRKRRGGSINGSCIMTELAFTTGIERHDKIKHKNKKIEFLNLIKIIRFR